MRWSLLFAMALVVLVLGLSLVAIDTLRSWGWPDPAPGDGQIQSYIRRDEHGRPVCRRGVPGDEHNRVEIGHNCP